MTDDRLISTSELCERYGRSTRTLNRWQHEEGFRVFGITWGISGFRERPCQASSVCNRALQDWHTSITFSGVSSLIGPS